MTAAVTLPLKRRRIDREGQEQAAYFHRLRVFMPEVWESAYHVPNGGKRNKVTAIILKSQGVKAGRPDIHIDIARGQYHGLRIELKATPPYDAEVSKDQQSTIDELNRQGYLAMVCLGQDAAWQATVDYMALGPFVAEEVACRF